MVRCYPAGRLWDILAELASMGDLPLPPSHPYAKRGREEYEEQPLSVDPHDPAPRHPIPSASQSTIELQEHATEAPRRYAGTKRVLRNAMPGPSQSATPIPPPVVPPIITTATQSHPQQPSATGSLHPSEYHPSSSVSHDEHTSGMPRYLEGSYAYIQPLPQGMSPVEGYGGGQDQRWAFSQVSTPLSGRGSTSADSDLGNAPPFDYSIAQHGTHGTVTSNAWGPTTGISHSAGYMDTSHRPSTYMLRYFSILTFWTKID